jgi:predicted MFS family arabinose efflux permease
MGIIGAAFGLGFIMGPALGGLLGTVSSQAPFHAAGILSLLNALLIWVRLPETYTPEKRRATRTDVSLGEVFGENRRAFILLLLVASLLSTTGFAFIHVLFALFCGDHFGWTIREISYAFAFVGVLAVLVQGGLLRRLLKRNIEKQVAAAGAFCLSLSLFWLPRVSGKNAFLGSCALMALGNGLLTPTLSGMASRFVHGGAQGRLMGLMTSAGSLGRFLGPALAVVPLPAAFSTLARPLQGELFDTIQAGYLASFSAGASLVAASLVCVLLLRLPTQQTAQG